MPGKRLLAAAAVLAVALAWPAAADAHGDRVPVDQLHSAWEPSPIVVGSAMLVLALFVQGWARLRWRGRADHASVWRLVCFIAALALGVLPLISPLDAVGEEYLISAHMLEHVLIADAAVALALLAVSGPLLFFLLPRPALLAAGRSPRVRTALRALGRPLVAFGLWAGVIALWHVPPLYDATLTNRAIHDLEHASFVLVGLLMWYQLIDPARKGQLSRGQRLGLAAAMFGAGQILSSVLLFATDPLYPAYSAQDERLFGLSVLTDQRLAGAVMMAEQAVTIGVFGLFLLLVADQEARAAEAAGQPALPVEPRA